MTERVEYIFREEMKGDTSFQERETGFSLLFGGEKYSKHDMRNTWENGIKYGIEIGLQKASLEGQRIELNQNTKDSNHLAFLEKFYRIAEEHNCAIQYHPVLGMTIISR